MGSGVWLLSTLGENSPGKSRVGPARNLCAAPNYSLLGRMAGSHALSAGLHVPSCPLEEALMDFGDCLCRRSRARVWHVSNMPVRWDCERQVGAKMQNHLKRFQGQVLS